MLRGSRPVAAQSPESCHHMLKPLGYTDCPKRRFQCELHGVVTVDACGGCDDWEADVIASPQSQSNPATQRTNFRRCTAAR